MTKASAKKKKKTGNNGEKTRAEPAALAVNTFTSNARRRNKVGTLLDAAKRGGGGKSGVD